MSAICDALQRLCQKEITLTSSDSMFLVLRNVIDSLIAAKTIYFGVGGGTMVFAQHLSQVRDDAGCSFVVDVVKEVSSVNMVKREVIRVRWRAMAATFE